MFLPIVILATDDLFDAEIRIKILERTPEEYKFFFVEKQDSITGDKERTKCNETGGVNFTIPNAKIGDIFSLFVFDKNKQYDPIAESIKIENDSVIEIQYRPERTCTATFLLVDEFQLPVVNVTFSISDQSETFAQGTTSKQGMLVVADVDLHRGQTLALEPQNEEFVSAKYSVVLDDDDNFFTQQIRRAYTPYQAQLKFVDSVTGGPISNLQVQILKAEETIFDDATSLSGSVILVSSPKAPVREGDFVTVVTERDDYARQAQNITLAATNSTYSIRVSRTERPITKVNISFNPCNFNSNAKGLITVTGPNKFRVVFPLNRNCWYLTNSTQYPLRVGETYAYIATMVGFDSQNGTFVAQDNKQVVIEMQQSAWVTGVMAASGVAAGLVTASFGILQAKISKLKKTKKVL